MVTWTFFSIALLWDWNGNWPFQFCGNRWVFQICWSIKCITLTASYFRIWNSSAGIPSSPVRSIPLLSIIVPIFAWYIPFKSLIFLKTVLVFPFYCFPLFVCTDHLGRLSYCSLLFFGTLHSDRYTYFFFSPLPFTSFLFSAICKARQQFFLFAFLSLGDGLDHRLLYSIVNLHP